jgi:Uma2 family endonuclease
MTTNIAIAPNSGPAAPKQAGGLSWADFEKKYAHKEDGFKYEWANQRVIKSKSTDYTQFYIVQNLIRLFDALKVSGAVKGMLMAEGDIFFKSNHRRPDLAFLSDTQIARTAYGQNQVPAFVIEIISSKDQMNLVHEKMNDYRAAGVQIVWHIFPKIQEVHIYSGPMLKQMQVAIGADMCSATDAIMGFKLSANAVFEKPAIPEED